MKWCFVLLTTQRLHRIRPRRLDRLIPHRQPCNNKRSNTSENVHQYADLNLVRIILQPKVDRIPRDRCRQNKCDNDQLPKFLRQEHNNTGHGSAKHFPNSNLLRTLFSSKGGEREKSKARNNDRQSGEDCIVLSQAFICL
jgi:hypothetical protein